MLANSSFLVIEYNYRIVVNKYLDKIRVKINVFQDIMN